MKIIMLAVTGFLAWEAHGYFGPVQLGEISASSTLIVNDPSNAIPAESHTTTLGLSDQFWEWEAAGRLRLIDAVLDENLDRARQEKDIHDFALSLIRYQMAAYHVDGRMDFPRVVVTSLRGDANGLYVPQERTIYLNAKIKWDELPTERFLEVVWHENMHHILTHLGETMAKNDPLWTDFFNLSYAAYFHREAKIANNNVEPHQTNPQELVAYRSQRAARYAGLLQASLTAEHVSQRMAEIRVLRVR